MEEVIEQDISFAAYVFVKDCDRLHELATKGLQKRTYYEDLQMAGILRRLFTEGAPLIETISQHYRQKIWVFNALHKGEHLNAKRMPEVDKIWHQAAPGVKIGMENTHEVYGFKLKHYLNMEIGRLNGSITPRFIIKYYANTLGGVHFGRKIGSKKAKKQVATMKMDLSVQIMGSQPSKLFLDQVCLPLWNSTWLFKNTLIKDGIVPKDYE